jgi:hypothetical protein
MVYGFVKERGKNVSPALGPLSPAVGAVAAMRPVEGCRVQPAGSAVAEITKGGKLLIFGFPPTIPMSRGNELFAEELAGDDLVMTKMARQKIRRLAISLFQGGHGKEAACEVDRYRSELPNRNHAPGILQRLLATAPRN